MHRILERQVKRLISDIEKIPPEWKTFLDVISNTYSDFDKDHELLSRSLELSSKEFSENNKFLQEAKTGVEKIVQERTVELKNAKKLLEEKNIHLQAALNSKNDFIKIANHQLNTPISIMQNAYNMVLDKSLTPERGIKYWGAGLERLGHVVEDFWNALQSDGQVKYNINKSNIEPAIKNSVENAEKIIVTNKKKIKIVIEKPAFTLPSVLCDIKKIYYVIRNLLDNAIDYTDKGIITVGYQIIDKDYLKISIKDMGIGFSEKDKERFGEKFYRTEQAVLSRPNGSGLGIYICRNIVESNGGKLFYESEGKNKGSTFSFTLPIAK